MKKLLLVFLLISFPVLAQEVPKLQCVPRYSLSADTVELHLMWEKDNDRRWVLLTLRNSGKQSLGFITSKDLFCLAVEGKGIKPQT